MGIAPGRVFIAQENAPFPWLAILVAPVPGLLNRGSVAGCNAPRKPGLTGRG
jgi:hypothetical protein